MDMSPPLPPPNLTQSSHQESLDAFERIVGLQSWLAREQAALPALPQVVQSATMQPYLLELDSYWRNPPTDTSGGGSRREVLASRMAMAVRDAAVLAYHDGRLDAAGLASIRSLTSVGRGPLPAGLTVRELLFGQTPYAGVLLLQDEQDAGRTLLFSHDRGWETYRNLVDAHAELERRARLALVRMPDLGGMARQHLGSIGTDPFVGSREIAGDPFAALVDRMIGVQQDKLRQAWFEHSLDDDEPVRASAFADAAFDALRFEHALDVESLLATRHANLLTTINEQRLERVPAKVAAAWKDADEAYQEALHSIAGREAAAGLQPPLDLPDYASREIAGRLRAMGVTQEPAHIQVRMDRDADITARLESLQALFEGTAAVHVKLVDLAYQNISAFDMVRLSAVAGDGSPIDALSDSAIRELVRDLDLSTRYRTYVDTTYRTGDTSSLRRVHATDLQRAHMRLLATEARLSYYLDDAPRSFRSDHAERGYRWVEAVLDSPSAAGRAPVEGHDVVVRQVTYLGTPLRDVLVVGVRRAESVPSVVLYTPGAPDGITFREFDDRAEAARRFFYHPAFREYLLDRLPADAARVLPNGHARAFAGDHLANWVLGAADSSAYTRTAARFEEREVSGDFLTAAYELDVQSGLRNMQVFARSAEQADWVWLRGYVSDSLSSRMVADVLKGVVTAPARAAQAGWRFYDNVKAGDYPEAAVDFADFYNASLSAALPVYALGSTSAAHAIAGARFRAGTRLVEARPAVQPVVVFEPRFMARNVRKVGPADREGIFTIAGNRYIEHQGQLYRVVHDRDIGGWRLSRPEAGATFRGPAIQRTTAGTWSYRRVGLRGGSGRGQPGTADRLPDLYDELQAEVELAFTDPLERELVAARMRFERTPYEGRVEGYSPPVISAGQRARWTAAMDRARARMVRRRSQPSRGTQGAAIDLSREQQGFRALRQVPRADTPAELWYYGRLPFKDSDLFRPRGRLGYSQEMAEIKGTYLGEGTHGVRVPTVPPTAPIEQIRQAMGAPDLTRATTFSVRIDPGSLHEPMSATWRSRYWLAGDGPLAELLTPNAGPGNVFIARPLTGGSNLALGIGQFEVESMLPPVLP